MFITFLVQHDVEPEDLEAHVVHEVLGLTTPVILQQYGLNGYECLYDYVLYLLAH
jgi:hypothetical protein